MANKLESSKNEKVRLEDIIPNGSVSFTIIFILQPFPTSIIDYITLN